MYKRVFFFYDDLIKKKEISIYIDISNINYEKIEIKIDSKNYFGTDIKRKKKKITWHNDIYI